MTYRKRTLTQGRAPKKLDPAPAHPGASHTLRVPGIAGKLHAVGMSRTESGKIAGPAAELHPGGINSITGRPHRRATQAIVDNEAGEAVRDRRAPAPVHPGTRSRNDDPLN